MDASRYLSTRAGRIITVDPGRAEYVAFLPSRIPRSLDFSREVVLALSDADQALGRLAGVGRLLPNSHVVIQPYLRREAVASTRIEGAQSSLSEVLSVEARALPESPDVREVLNYVRAFELGLRRLSELPLSTRLIRELHEELLRGVRGHGRTPGEFRRSQNWIGGIGPSDAAFVPPPHQELPDLLTDFERFLHEEAVPLPILVRCALLHYQFETIHPFLDGNGRLGRLLVVFYLVAQGALREPFLYLSSYLERHRQTYVARLQGVREVGDYDSWLVFFLEAMGAQARSAATTAETLIGLGADFRERLRSIRARGRAIDAAERLIGNPFVTAPRLAQTLGLSRQGALYVIQTLERAGIVVETPSDDRTALFVAREVLDLLEADEA